MRTRVPLIAALLSALSCGGATEAPPAGGEPVGRETQAWMRSHFMEGRAIRDALIEGHLDDAHARLSRLGAEPGPSDAPTSWEPRIAAMRTAATDASRAGDLPHTTAAFARVATRCADCHSALNAHIAFERLPQPPEAPAPMERHQWAAERMWQGLVAPDPTRYREGATVLEEAPLHPAELRVGASPPLAVVQLSEQVRGIAGRAADASSQAGRAALYGELLATCAACHGQR